MPVTPVGAESDLGHNTNANDSDESDDAGPLSNSYSTAMLRGLDTNAKSNVAAQNQHQDYTVGHGSSDEEEI